MLEQLIESKNNVKETAKRAKFLGTTSVLVVSLAFSGILWSLFAKNVAMRGDQFEISAMVAPVPIPENKPQPIEPKQEPPKNAPKIQSDVPTRRTNTLRIDENPIAPKEISTTPNTEKARPNQSFKITRGDEKDVYKSSFSAEDRNSNSSSNGLGNKINSNDSKPIETTPPPPLPPIAKNAEPEKTKVQQKISGGVLNGKAEVLPKPVYSAAARAVNANGEVQVQITVDENGKVVSANAVSGHPLLKPEAEKAARGARFSPTLLSGQPVKVTGIIVYRFSK